MKKLLFLMCTVTSTFFVIGCGGFDPGVEPIPQCDFSGTEEIFFTDFGLRLPNIQYTNVAFHNAFNVGGTIYNLNTVLDPKGDYRFTENRSEIRGSLRADGTLCKGDKPFLYRSNNPNVLSNSIKVPAPSNTNFSGEVTIIIKTDSFREQGSGNNNHGFYVRWETTANNPDIFVNGNILGEKVGFDWDLDLIYIPDEEPIYSDGGYDHLGGEPII